MKTLKILSLLLTYPEKELISDLPKMLEILRNENWLSKKTMKSIENIVSFMTSSELMDIQEEYVDMFDRTPSLSLHLFEHVHGDSRERGQAMVDLSELYKAKGFIISGKEMPDYLPLFLEYLSTQKLEDVKEHLGSIVNILASIEGRLSKRGSKYTGIFKALEEASHKKPNMNIVEAALSKFSGRASSNEEIDKSWEEQAAFENNSLEPKGCSKMADIVSRLKDTQKDNFKETGS